LATIALDVPVKHKTCAFDENHLGCCITVSGDGDGRLQTARDSAEVRRVWNGVTVLEKKIAVAPVIRSRLLISNSLAVGSAARACPSENS
jgi:hypothetical protein